MTDEISQTDDLPLRFSASANDPLYEAVQSLEEAQRQQGFSLIMEGDYGGQIYLTCPVGLLGCDHQTLVQLLEDIDLIQRKEPLGRGLFFEKMPVGAYIQGGMGGAPVCSDLWIHEEIYAIGMEEAIRLVISGVAERLEIPTIEDLCLEAASGSAKKQYFFAEQLRWYVKRGGEQIRSERRKWYTKAAEQGHVKAQYHLTGDEGTSSAERVRWMCAIVARDDRTEKDLSWVKMRLAERCESGDGIARDIGKAAELYEQLCNCHYHQAAAIRLGEMYLCGKGVSINKSMALMWLLRASYGATDELRLWQGYIYKPDEREHLSECIEEAKLGMTDDEISQTEQAAREWLEKERIG